MLKFLRIVCLPKLLTPAPRPEIDDNDDGENEDDGAYDDDDDRDDDHDYDDNDKNFYFENGNLGARPSRGPSRPCWH